MASVKELLILSILDGSPNRLREKYFHKYHNDIYNEIIEYCKNIDDIKFPFKVWHWVNEKPDYIRCYCGNRLSTNMNWQDGYKKYCSNKCSANNQSTLDKYKETILNKWGVDHYSKTEEYVDKVKKTSIIKWGVDNYSKTEDYIDKSKKSYLNKWGVDNFTKTEEYLEKSKKTCLDKWGVNSYTKTEDFRNKIKNKNIEKYGKKHIFQNEEYRKNNFKISNDKYYISYNDNLNKFKCDFGHDHIFEIKTDDYYGRKKANNKLCTICNPISINSSLKEISLYNFINEIYKKEIINKYRNKYEIDIYLPDLKIGFEFNGLYWHSEEYKEKNYHINKTNFFKERGIRIIHIWEDDWIYKNNIIKSQIKNWLGLTEKKIFARKCEIKEVNTNESSSFLDNNHIQGKDKSLIKIGLFYEDKLVSLMTFNKSEGRKKMPENEWNLSRFCNIINSNVIGGASKLFNYFVKNYKPSRIVSYADKDWSDGSLYYKLGFELVYETRPDYKYILNDKRVHKSNFKKSKLNTNLSESEFMKESKIYKIWDCGKIKIEKKVLLNEGLF